MSAGRSVSDVFQNIVQNVQEMVRSEIRLAKTEIRQEVIKTKSATLLLLTGALISIFAIFFVLLGVVYALAVVIPSWGAALIVGGVLAGVGSAILVTSLKRLKRVNPTPEHTVENIKENIAWAKRHTK
jgi:uncharacterized membrane protein YqjE